MKKMFWLLLLALLFSCSESELPPPYETPNDPGQGGPSDPSNPSSSGGPHNLSSSGGSNNSSPSGGSSSSFSSSSSLEPEVLELRTVLFNEIHTMNSGYKDEDGADPDWVEFYNPNDTVVNLRGFVLTENQNVATWKFGNVKVQPNSYLVVFFSGKNRPDPIGTNKPHTNFELKNAGGKIFLINTQNQIKDSITYREGTRELSYGKKNGSTEWTFHKPPTPGAKNSDETYAGQVQPPPANILPPSGFYTSSLSFTIPENIYCERTGDLPTVNSSMKPGNAITLDSNSILRCAQFFSGAYPSEPIMRTYLIRSNIGGTRKPSLPIVSIAAPSNFKSIYDGISQNSGDFEMPIHVDFFENNVEHKWSHPAELGPMGSASRAWPKKPVSVSFKEKYGQKNIQYPLFPDYPQLTKFKHFVLRNNGNNWENDYIRDMLMTSLTEGMGIDYQKGRAVIVYYNGRYYGIHNLRERSNGDYYETNYNINEDYINLVKIVDPTVNSSGLEVSRGSAADYQSILSWLNSITTLSDAHLETLKERIDVDNFTDHFQSRIFYNDRDWPGKNVKVWNTTNSASTKWRFFMHDTDHGFGSWGTEACQGWTMLRVVTTETDGCQKYGWPNPRNSTLILRRLLTNKNYENAFINRFSLLIATYFTSTRVNARITKLMSDINSELTYDRERWSPPEHRPLSTIQSFANSRPAAMQSEITSHFNLSSPVDITISGYTHVDGLFIPSFAGSSVTFKAYPGVPMVLRWGSGQTTTIDVGQTTQRIFTAGQ